jgi:ubiquinone/menaquinone biosynthesis C-methylase UbiE
MHDTASQIGARFFSVYLAGKASDLQILDVGSLDVNGSLRQFAPSGAIYMGVDLAPGPGVDLVLDDPHKLPFEDEKFDAIVSTSSFEHDSMFWLTFLEMVRVAKVGAAIYINAPSNATYHRYPRDCWRFYPDAAISLIDWSQRNGHPLALVESFIALRKKDVWNDCVMVFVKGEARDPKAPKVIDHFPGSQNVRLSYDQLEVQNFSASTEDMLLIEQHRSNTIDRSRATATGCRMLEIRVSFSSEEEWKSWLSAYQGKFPSWRADVLKSVRAGGFSEPITHESRPPEGITINEANLRESISIAELNSRKRAALLCLDLEQQNLKDERARGNPKILGAEALTRIAKILRGAFFYYLGTECLPTAQEQEKHFPIIHADLGHLSFSDKTFDLFFGGDIVGHLPDIESAFREIVRILKAEGVAVCTFPFRPGQSKTHIKARLIDGQVEHLEAPEDYGGPGRPANDSLVFSSPGWDILDLCKKAGFAHARMTLVASSTFGITSSGAPGVFVLIATKGDAAQNSIKPVPESQRRDSMLYQGPCLRRVVGLLALPRSGTTLLSSILGVHSNIRSVYEPWNANKKVEVRELITINTFFHVFPTAMEDKTTLLVKETASKIEYLDKVAELLRSVDVPIERSMITLLRNPLHVFLSEVEGRKTWWGESNLEHTIDVFDAWAARTIASIKRLLRLGGEFSTILVSYEALVTRKRETIQSLMNFLELPFEEEQLRFESYVKRSEVRGDINIATDPKEISTFSLERRTQETSKLETILGQSKHATLIMAIGDACKKLETESSLRIHSPTAQEIITPLWELLNANVLPH